MICVASSRVSVGSRSASHFRYQHVGICSRWGSRPMQLGVKNNVFEGLDQPVWGSRPTQGSNAKGCALWWNIGNIEYIYIPYI